MELIIAILVAVLVYISSSRKGGGKRAADIRAQRAAQLAKNAAARGGIPDMSQAERAREKVAKAKAAAPEAVPRVEPAVQAAPQMAFMEGESMLLDPDCVGGSMAHTHDEGHGALVDEECVGGSMEHTHTEGVSRADQARRMAAIDAQADRDVLPDVIDARALRRAVVMAEVLGKPRALRRG